MQDCISFIKGQVWHWNDPIYGKKYEGKQVAELESTVRYSRYVVIAENSKPTMPTILVIPLTTYKHDNDVKILLKTHSQGNLNVSYAHVETVFPVSKKSLSRYVCTLSQDKIEEISNQMRNVFDLNTISFDSFLTNNSNEVSLLRMISNELLLLLNSYSNNMKIQEEIVEEIEIKELELLEDIPEDQEDEKEEEIVEVETYTKSSRSSWTNEKIQKFLSDYEILGITKTAEKYSLTKGTVSVYFNKFTKKLKEINEIKELKKEEDNSYKLDKKEVLSSIHQFVDDMIIDMKKDNLLETLARHKENKRKDMPAAWYDEELKNWLGQALIDTMGIDLSSSKPVIINEINALFWSYSKQVKESNININFKIDKKYLDFLRNNVLAKGGDHNLYLTKKGVDKIVKYVDSHYC